MSGTTGDEEDPTEGQICMLQRDLMCYIGHVTRVDTIMEVKEGQ